MFRITYVYHSCFTIELDNTVLIFDFTQGVLPQFDTEKTIYVFASHRHPDHFKPKVFELVKRYPKIHFFLSDDIRQSSTWFARLRITDKDLKDYVTVIRPDRKITYSDLTIESLKSTDEGVAFLITAEEKHIYHAGDLNWWHWDGEPEQENLNMAAQYKEQIDSISGRSFDVSFVPLDPRLKDAYGYGMDYFLTHTLSKAVFPMHMWDKYDWTDRYLKTETGASYRDLIYKISAPGDVFDLA